MNKTTESKFYALLIGINDYESIHSPNYPQLYRNLRGCVRDIDLVADYLEKTLQTPKEQIWKLTAPIKESYELSQIRNAQKPPVKPTYENIVKAFTEITAAANSGDRVYVHYSGHGGRASTLYEDIKGEVKYDETIVPMDIAHENGHHLRDVEITTLLKRITDKNCILTVVFDSCHSGGATRGDFAIRGSDEIDDKDRNQESLVASREELIDNWKNATNTEIWLPQSKEYIFIGACLDTEVAYEYRIEGERHGALTYWMLKTLATLSPGSTYQMLYERLNAIIRSEFRERQTPVLMGEANRLIFGSESISYQYSVTVLSVTETEQITKIELNAGLTTGIGNGARFGIYPLGIKDLSDPAQQIAVVEIVQPFAAKSDAEVVSIAAGKTIEQGAQAVMLSPPIDLVQTVNLFEKEAGTRDNQLPPELLARQDNALNAVRKAMKGSGWLEESKGHQRKEHFQVSIDREGEYEISRGLPIENLRPAVKIDDPDAATEIVKRLVHLAKYSAVQRLKNPYSNSIKVEVELIAQNGLLTQENTKANNITLKSGEIAILRIKNISSQAINIVVIDLEPTWEISQLRLRPISEKTYRFAPNEEVNLKLRLSLPDEEKYDRALEVIKVFAMLGQADFRWLELPLLDKPLVPKGLTPANTLEELFAALGADPEAPPPVERQAQVIFDPSEKWATKEIQITVMR